MSNTARTIDGMRVPSSTPKRAVGFSGTTARRATQSSQKVAVKRAATRSSVRSSATATKKGADFGLARDTMEKARKRLAANEDFIKPVSTLDFDLSSKELKPDYSLKKRTGPAEAPRQGKKIGKGGKKKHTARKVLIGVLVLLLAGGGAFMIWGNTLISKLTSGRSGIFDAISALTSNVELKKDKNGRTNVLVFGTSGYNMEGEVVPGGEHDGAQLTDSIMLVSLDQETKDVAMVSLPRDLYVGNTCTSTGKVNEIYWCANMYGEDEEAGAAALIREMKEIMDVDIQYRVHVDWSALIQIVDGLGGITVTLDEDIEDDWTGTYIRAGEPVQLNGERALGLARARHGTEMGDFTRGNSQQKILAAIQDKLINEGIDFGRALALVEAIGDNVRMDFSLDEVKSVYYLAKDIPLASMRQVPLLDYEKKILYLTTADMNGISYVVPTAGMKNYTQIQKYLEEQLKTPEPEPEPTEEPAEESTIEQPAVQ